MKRSVILSAAIAAALPVLVARAENPAAGSARNPSGDSSRYVTREEYEKLKAELDAVKREMSASKKDNTNVKKQAEASQQEVDETLDQIQKDLKKYRGDADALRLGTSRFLITGYAFAGFTDQKKQNSSFNAGLSPIFLWKVSDRIFVEAETELSLSTDGGAGTTHLNLEYADINYILNDYLTFRAGKFLAPFGQFSERLHPAWINKLPDFPLPFQEDTGLVQFSSLGFELRGAAPIGTTQVNYAAYVSNGPGLITDDPARAGSLNFDNFSDNNRNKAVGGRIGFLPIPQLELGYSIQDSQVGDGAFRGTHALLQAVDASYLKEIEAIYGTLDVRAEWVWSDVDRATYDPTGARGFGPLSFNNRRNGGYVQLAYRPTRLSNRILKNLEFVGRYDLLDVPKRVPGATSEHRLTFGIDYWFDPSSVLKFAYEIDDKRYGDNQNAFFIQAATGF